MVTCSQYLLVTVGRLADHSAMASTDTPLVAARRSRLRLWIQQKHGGSRKEFLEAVKARGFDLNPSEVSNLQTGNKSFGENKAAEYEAAAGMPRGFLVNALDPLSQPARLDTEILLAAITLAKKALRLGAGEELVIERDPELFAQALRTAIAKRFRLEGGHGTELGTRDGQVGAAGSAARAQEGGASEKPAPRAGKRNAA